MYLTQDAMLETLSFILYDSGKGSVILFDYKPPSIKEYRSIILQKLRRVVVGKIWKEQFLNEIEEIEIKRALDSMGYNQVNSFTSDFWKEKYLSNRNYRKDEPFNLNIIRAQT